MMGTSYVKVAWIHQFQDDPVRIMMELDGERNELRKIEYFADGRIGVATREIETDLTFIGCLAVPPIEEINSDPQFFAEPISEGEFQGAWEEAVPTSDRR